MYRCIIQIFILSILTGCATGYHPKGVGGGYSSTQYGPNIFNVSFDGNGFTGRGRAADLALLRSAEISLEHGYRYFIISNTDTYTSTSRFTTPTTTNTYGTASVYGNTVHGSAISTTHGGQTYSVSRPSASNTIICYKERPSGMAYDATFLYQSLTSKYHIKRSSLVKSNPFEQMEPSR